MPLLPLTTPLLACIGPGAGFALGDSFLFELAGIHLDHFNSMTRRTSSFPLATRRAR